MGKKKITLGDSASLRNRIGEVLTKMHPQGWQRAHAESPIGADAILAALRREHPAEVFTLPSVQNAFKRVLKESGVAPRRSPREPSASKGRKPQGGVVVGNGFAKLVNANGGMAKFDRLLAAIEEAGGVARLRQQIAAIQEARRIDIRD